MIGLVSGRSAQARVVVDQHDFRAVLGKLAIKLCLSKQGRRLGVFEHERKSLFRVVRIEWKISAPAFKIPNRPTIMSSERSTQMATRASGPTPRPIK